MIRDFCAFSALVLFIYGMSLTFMAMDDRQSNASAIVATHERN